MVFKILVNLLYVKALFVEKYLTLKSFLGKQELCFIKRAK